MSIEHSAATAMSHATQSSILWLIPFLPAFGALANGTFGLYCKYTGKSAPSNKLIDTIALGSVGLAFCLALFLFARLAGLPSQDRSIVQDLWTWLSLGGAHVEGGLTHNTLSWAYKFDPLSGAMTLLVTGVGFLIHLFSSGYMSEERKNGQYYRFMTYLNLFVFSMLNLVLGKNIMMMFLGWEGVGLCSYLLIGFYFDLNSAATAGKKAFVTNRIGDFGFMIGFFILFMIYGSVDFDTLMGMTREIMQKPELTLFGMTESPAWWFNLAGISLFIGACGKSAQIPLYVWLPDAMAGPTPVSALIHAATMVTAGLYMMTRLNFIYINAQLALDVVLFTGALTALVAASMGLAQYDIKKVLAYSTVSQLGFMFMGMGAGAFSAGMFHVFTHAFFKAALFLGAGSVIAACHHEQDMRNMGGLRKYMPKTYLAMLVATLAIAGIFPFSGFFSKDEILWKVFEGWHSHGHRLNLLAWIMGMAGTFMTAFYMVRLMIMTFGGEYRGSGHDPHPHAMDDPADHTALHGHMPHEVEWKMWLPVAILAGLALVAGFINIPHSLHVLGSAHFDEWLSPLLYEPSAAHASHTGVPVIEYVLQAWATLIWAPGAMLLAWWIYQKDPGWRKAKAFVHKFPTVFKWVHHKYYVDELYEIAIIRPCKALGERLWAFDAWVVDGIVNGAARVTLLWSHASHWIDRHLVDGSVNLVAWLLQLASGVFGKLQSGRVQHYALVMFVGFVLAAFWKFLA